MGNIELYLENLYVKKKTLENDLEKVLNQNNTLYKDFSKIVDEIMNEMNLISFKIEYLLNIINNNKNNNHESI